MLFLHGFIFLLGAVLEIIRVACSRDEAVYVGGGAYTPGCLAGCCCKVLLVQLACLYTLIKENNIKMVGKKAKRQGSSQLYAARAVGA